MGLGPIYRYGCIFSLFLGLVTSCHQKKCRNDDFSYTPRCNNETWTPKNPCISMQFPPLAQDLSLFDEPITLCQLLDFALINNPTTEKSWANAKAAFYNFNASKSVYMPTIDVQAGLSAVQNSQAAVLATSAISTVGTLNNIATLNGVVVSQGLLISYLLLDFGGRCGEVQAAKHALLAQNWTHNQALQNVLFDVIKNYYAALQAYEEVAAKELDLEDAKETARAAEFQLKLGLKSRIDYLQAQSNLMKIEVDYQEALGKREIANADLAIAVGISPTTHIIITPVLEIPQVAVKQDIEALIADAKLERNDLASLMATYNQKNAEVTKAKSALWPKVVSSLNLYNYDFLGGPVNTAHTYVSTVGLTWNLFNGFKDYYNIYKAKADREVAYASWMVQENQVALDVVTSYNQFLTANENLYFSKEYLLYADEAYKAALIGYKSGTQNILDVLSTQKTLAEARSKEIEARSNWLTSLANISYATGQLDTSCSPPYIQPQESSCIH